ncbi:hypothetical protein J4G08_17995 [Candidatus Poribacteria bacterium]|nr:hypothetical protein [Candidatus Poribacteria bacterium]
MDKKQSTELEQQEMMSEHSVESEQSEDASDNTTGLNVFGHLVFSINFLPL